MCASLYEERRSWTEFELRFMTLKVRFMTDEVRSSDIGAEGK